ncbi:type II secretion system protein [Alienimonas sp. DA493]|uniref:type II secretion system protein n=1 Tax=Alienimonas sp. DA493 TaxID=3373605 RepID=UPI003754B05F
MTCPGSSAVPPSSRPTPAGRRGFTIIEGLIAVTLIALLAVTVLPQLHPDAAKGVDEQLRERLYVLRGQIELYRVQHENTLPGVTGPLLEQLTRRTDRAGNVGEGGDHVFGPYLVGGAFPENPVTGRSEVLVVSEMSKQADPEDAVHGWIYDVTTGELRAAGDAERFAW